jgi:hypothetical protein
VCFVSPRGGSFVLGNPGVLYTYSRLESSLCDALKNVTRRVLLEKEIESRKAERKAKVTELKKPFACAL